MHQLDNERQADKQRRQKQEMHRWKERNGSQLMRHLHLSAQILQQALLGRAFDWSLTHYHASRLPALTSSSTPHILQAAHPLASLFIGLCGELGLSLWGDAVLGYRAL